MKKYEYDRYEVKLPPGTRAMLDRAAGAAGYKETAPFVRALLRAGIETWTGDTLPQFGRGVERDATTDDNG